MCSTLLYRKELKMAFVKITNGIKVLEVQSGAFESIYKGLGFRLADGKQAKAKKEEVKVDTDEEVKVDAEEDDNELFIQEMKEVPISKWKKDEVKKFASLVGIDITGTSFDGAKELIKDYLVANE